MLKRISPTKTLRVQESRMMTSGVLRRFRLAGIRVTATNRPVRPAPPFAATVSDVHLTLDSGKSSAAFD